MKSLRSIHDGRQFLHLGHQRIDHARRGPNFVVHFSGGSQRSGNGSDWHTAPTGAEIVSGDFDLLSYDHTFEIFNIARGAIHRVRVNRAIVEPPAVSGRSNAGWMWLCRVAWRRRS